MIKLNTIRLFLCLSFSMVSPSSFANKTETNCKDCVEAAAIIKELRTLDPKNSEHAIRGLDLIQKALPLFIKIDEDRSKSKLRDQLVPNLIELSAAALPFDQESQLTGFLGEWIEKTKDIGALYQKGLSALPKKTKEDKCRVEELDARVNEQACFVREKATPMDKVSDKSLEEANNKCLSKFNKETCLK